MPLAIRFLILQETYLQYFPNQLNTLILSSICQNLPLEEHINANTQQSPIQTPISKHKTDTVNF